MQKRKLLVSFNINILLVALAIIGMGVGVIDTAKRGVPYESAFRYYTVLSNLFLMVAAAILVVYQSLFIAKKIKFIPKWSYIVKLCAVTATSITFFVVISFLTPLFATKQVDIPGFGLDALYTGSNLIFHVISPIVGAVAFLLFETRKDIKLWQNCFAMIFTAVYEIFYTTDVYCQYFPESWGSHDWYGFTLTPVPIWLSLILFLGASFLISWLLWLGNKNIHIWEKKNATK